MPARARIFKRNLLTVTWGEPSRGIGTNPRKPYRSAHHANAQSPRFGILPYTTPGPKHNSKIRVRILFVCPDTGRAARHAVGANQGGSDAFTARLCNWSYCSRSSDAQPTRLRQSVSTVHGCELRRPGARLRLSYAFLCRSGEVSVLAPAHGYARTVAARRDVCAAPCAAHRARGDRDSESLWNKQWRHALRHEGSRRDRTRDRRDQRPDT